MWSTRDNPDDPAPRSSGTDPLADVVAAVRAGWTQPVSSAGTNHAERKVHDISMNTRAVHKPKQVHFEGTSTASSAQDSDAGSTADLQSPTSTSPSSPLTQRFSRAVSSAVASLHDYFSDSDSDAAAVDAVSAPPSQERCDVDLGQRNDVPQPEPHPESARAQTKQLTSNEASSAQTIPGAMRDALKSLSAVMTSRFEQPFATGQAPRPVSVGSPHQQPPSQLETAHATTEDIVGQKMGSKKVCNSSSDYLARLRAHREQRLRRSAATFRGQAPKHLSTRGGAPPAAVNGFSA